MRKREAIAVERRSSTQDREAFVGQPSGIWFYMIRGTRRRSVHQERGFPTQQDAQAAAEKYLAAIRDSLLQDDPYQEFSLTTGFQALS
jgi:hypothetical protein